VEGIIEGGIGPPKGCVVEQVHMVILTDATRSMHER
jgi:hypothetical protein